MSGTLEGPDSPGPGGPNPGGPNPGDPNPGPGRNDWTSQPQRDVQALFVESFEQDVDFSRWKPSNSSLKPRFVVGDSVGPVDGRSALQVTVQPGDHAQVGRSGSSTERAEIQSTEEIVRFDQEVWYTFSFLVPSSFPRANNRTIIHQIKENVRGGNCEKASPFFAVEAQGGENYVAVVIRVAASVDCSHEKPMRRQVAVAYDEWHTIRVHMLPSHDPQKGFVTAWVDNHDTFRYQGLLGYATYGRGYVDTQPRFGVYRDHLPQPGTIHFDRIVFWNTDATPDPRWVAVGSGPVQLPTTPQPKGLVLHWTFDETNGRVAADSSNNGNDGTLQEGGRWGPGRFSNALEFDGRNQYLQTQRDLSTALEGDCAVSAWFRFTGQLNARILDLGLANSRGLQLKTSMGKVGFDNSGGPDLEVFADPLVNDGNWHHAALVRRGVTYSIYVDGQKSQATSTGLPNPYRWLTVGARNDSAGPDKLFQGQIDDVRVYRGTLTDTDVLQIYQGQ